MSYCCPTRDTCDHDVFEWLGDDAAVFDAACAVVGLFWSLRLLIERRNLDHGVSSKRFRTGYMMREIDKRVAAR